MDDFTRSFPPFYPPELIIENFDFDKYSCYDVYIHIFTLSGILTLSGIHRDPPHGGGYPRLPSV